MGWGRCVQEAVRHWLLRTQAGPGPYRDEALGTWQQVGRELGTGGEGVTGRPGWELGGLWPA